MVKDYNTIVTTLLDYLTWKKKDKKQKTKQTKKVHAFLRNYHTFYSLILNGDLLTTGVAKEAV